MAVHPPFPYYGGKFRHIDVLLPLLPVHKTYVEVFGGSAAVLLNKPPSPVEVYNDVDSGVVNFFRVLRDHTEELIRRVALTPYSREEYDACWRNWSRHKDPIERARMWYFAAATSFNGRFGHGLSVSARKSHRGVACHVSSYLTRVESLWAVAARFQTVIIENKDFRQLIRQYDSEETVLYADPPYFPETRNKDADYTYELTADDHRDLVELLLNIRGKAVLSGYDNPVYKELERAGWRKITYRMRTTATLRRSLKGNDREECVWVSPQ